MFILAISLLLLSPLFIAGVIVTWTSTHKKLQIVLTSVTIVGALCLGYRAGFSSGADANCYRVRQEMKPLLAGLIARSGLQDDSDLRLLVTVADQSKMDADTYFRFVAPARASIQKKPNKALEPTPTAVTSPAAQEPRQP